MTCIPTPQPIPSPLPPPYLPSLARDMVVVVMGSVHRVGAPTRVMGGYEAERRVGHTRSVEGTDIMLLRLADPMPRTHYVNSLCLPR